MSFKNAMTEVLKSEGGYINDPDDAGGETYCGIARKFWPKWDGWKIIDRIKRNAGRQLRPNEKLFDKNLNKSIEDFYYKYFWVPLRCHQIKNSILAEHLFDCGINLGKKPAVRFFQQVISTYKGSPDNLVVDGLIGPKTIGGINRAPKWVTNYIVERRISLYFGKCYKKPVKFKWLKGWVLRSLKYLDK